MKAIVSIFGCLALLAVTWLLAETAWTQHQLRPKLLVTVSNVDRATIAIGAAAGNVEKASRAWEASSKAQAEQSTAVLISTKKTLASAQTLVSNLDAQFNQSVLPGLVSAISQQSQSLLETQHQTQLTLEQAREALKTINGAAQVAQERLSGPEVGDTLKNLNSSSKSLAEGTASLAVSAKDVQIVADHFKDDFVKPKNRAWAYVKAVLGLGSQGRILFNK